MAQEEALPNPLTEQFFKEEYMKIGFESLLSKGKEITIDINKEQCLLIESSTREQSNSRIWYQQRAGRITASKLKSVCHTKVEKPSQSLIKSICYPELHKFSNDATKWGMKYEDVARKAYVGEMEANHEDFTLSDSGFHVNLQWPFMGASPDGMVSCKCCGSGICEVKCPYKARDVHPLDAAATIKNFCLKQSARDACITLDKKHAYYYQVQAQLHICDVEFCDFIVWTTKGLFVERIAPDPDFWTIATREAREFFVNGILPEIMGKWYTRALVPCSKNLPSSDDDDAYWCICQQLIEDSTLIRCDNMNCKIKWYHPSCVQLKEIPQDKWLCPQCFSKP